MNNIKYWVILQTNIVIWSQDKVSLIIVTNDGCHIFLQEFSNCREALKVAWWRATCSSSDRTGACWCSMLRTGIDGQNRWGECLKMNLSTILMLGKDVAKSKRCRQLQGFDLITRLCIILPYSVTSLFQISRYYGQAAERARYICWPSLSSPACASIFPWFRNNYGAQSTLSIDKY